MLNFVYIRRQEKSFLNDVKSGWSANRRQTNARFFLYFTAKVGNGPVTPIFAVLFVFWLFVYIFPNLFLLVSVAVAGCTVLHVLQHAVHHEHGWCLLCVRRAQVHLPPHHDHERDGYVTSTGRQIGRQLYSWRYKQIDKQLVTVMWIRIRIHWGQFKITDKMKRKAEFNQHKSSFFAGNYIFKSEPKKK